MASARKRLEVGIRARAPAMRRAARISVAAERAAARASISIRSRMTRSASATSPLVAASASRRAHATMAHVVLGLERARRCSSFRPSSASRFRSGGQMTRRVAVARTAAIGGRGGLRRPGSRGRGAGRASTGAGASVSGHVPFWVFGNAMTSRIDSWPGQAGGQPVEAERDAAHGRRAELEGVEQESEARPGLFLGDADQAEDPLLHGLLMDADRAARRLLAVQHQVVGLGPGAAGVGSPGRQVLVARGGERDGGPSPSASRRRSTPRAESR